LRWFRAAWFGIVPGTRRHWFAFDPLLVHLGWLGIKRLQKRFDLVPVLVRFRFTFGSLLIRYDPGHPPWIS
jgi:hypothetical protein